MLRSGIIASLLAIAALATSAQAQMPGTQMSGTQKSDTQKSDTQKSRSEALDPETTSETTPKTIQAIHINSAPAVTRSVHRVPGAQTPSGFDVPRFVSLKFGTVNARTGPSRSHSIAYQYRQRGLPLLVVAETEMWRKVRDLHGDEAWVRKPALSGERFAVITVEADIRARPDSGAKRLARVGTGALVRLGECDVSGHCEITTRTNLKGYVPQEALWGAQALD